MLFVEIDSTSVVEHSNCESVLESNTVNRVSIFTMPPKPSVMMDGHYKTE